MSFFDECEELRSEEREELEQLIHKVVTGVVAEQLAPLVDELNRQKFLRVLGE